MDLHGNAALSLRGRERVVELRQRDRSLASAISANERSCRKWWQRWQTQGPASLRDRSSRPRSLPNATPADRVETIRLLRGLRFSGPQIAGLLACPARRFPGCSSAMGLAGWVGSGWLARRVEVSGRARWSISTRRGSAGHDHGGFIRRAIAFYAASGIDVERIHSDNGSAYRSTAFALQLRLAGIRHTRSGAYRPPTNGKAERVHPHDARGLGLRFDLRVLSRTNCCAGWSTTTGQRPHVALNGRPTAGPGPRPVQRP